MSNHQIILTPADTQIKVTAQCLQLSDPKRNCFTSPVIDDECAVVQLVEEYGLEAMEANPNFEFEVVLSVDLVEKHGDAYIIPVGEPSIRPKTISSHVQENIV